MKAKTKKILIHSAYIVASFFALNLAAVIAEVSGKLGDRVWAGMIITVCTMGIIGHITDIYCAVTDYKTARQMVIDLEARVAELENGPEVKNDETD